MPVVATDDFTGANNALLDGRAVGSQAWSCAGVALADIQLIRLNGTGAFRLGSGAGCLGRLEMGQADHYARLASYALTGSATVAVAVAVRCIDHTNFIGLRALTTTSVEIFKVVGGTQSSVIVIAVPALTAPVVLELTMAGTAARAFVNGAQVGAVAGYPITEPVFNGVTKAGIWARGTRNPAGDDFEGGTLSGAAVAVVPARGLSAQRAAAGGLALMLPLGVARAAHAQRGRAGGLSIGLGVGPAAARHVVRGAVGGLALPGGPVALMAAQARHGWRGGAARVGPRAPAITAGVGAEDRVVRVAGD